MDKKGLILLVCIVFSFYGNAQKKSSRKSDKDRYAIVEFRVKEKTDKKPLVFYIEIGKVGVIIINEDGYAKLFFKKGRYNILIKAVGYKNWTLKKLKLNSAERKSIDCEMEIKPENLY